MGLSRRGDISVREYLRPQFLDERGPYSIMWR